MTRKEKSGKKGHMCETKLVRRENEGKGKRIGLPQVLGPPPLPPTPVFPPLQAQMLTRRDF